MICNCYISEACEPMGVKFDSDSSVGKIAVQNEYWSELLQMVFEKFVNVFIDEKDIAFSLHTILLI